MSLPSEWCPFLLRVMIDAKAVVNIECGFSTMFPCSFPYSLICLTLWLVSHFNPTDLTLIPVSLFTRTENWVILNQLTRWSSIGWHCPFCHLVYSDILYPFSVPGPVQIKILAGPTISQIGPDWYMQGFRRTGSGTEMGRAWHDTVLDGHERALARGMTQPILSCLLSHNYFFGLNSVGDVTIQTRHDTIKK